MQAGDLEAGALVAMGASLLDGLAPLQPEQTLALLGAPHRPVQRLAIAGHEGDLDAPVDTDWRQPVGLNWRGFDLQAEGDVPAVTAAADGGVPERAGQL